MIFRRTTRSNNRPLAPDGATKEGPVAYRRDEPWESPTLWFSPTAWAKLLYLRDLGDTEVGGFGIRRQRPALPRGRAACAASVYWGISGLR